MFYLNEYLLIFKIDCSIMFTYNLGGIIMSYSKKIDEKWQKRWKEQNLYKFNPLSDKKKFYTMEMFSYPSGANLHLGHWFNFAPADSYARFKTMQGYNVFHPMGFDAFGLPAENYAIKTGIHPQDSTIKNIETMKKQLDEMGASYDWDYSVETCMPKYYKWTQWLFLQLYKNGLAYKKEAPVNWCDSCKTVLANEQVISGQCERCGTIVERKKLSQWFFKTTKYAQELLDSLDGLDWPETTKKIQTNWIGRSEGAKIKFKVVDQDLSFEVFTTRPDTTYGVSYVVVAPESDLAIKLTTPEQKAEIDAYRAKISKYTNIERMATDHEKTGVFTGSYVINPVNGNKVPVWVSDYVIEDYGTGAVMAVPAHDTRDYEFAQKFGLNIVRVIANQNGDETLPFVENGILVNSDEFNGLTSEEAKAKIVEKLAKTKDGEKVISYKLRDWLVSRQRYWGAPIPVVYCDKCGIVPVPERDLPVLLPYDVEFKPDGESPLKKSESFRKCKCPKCNGEATREVDTLDTFVCSSWYFLRYPDANNEKEAWNKDLINKMLPVDTYVGGKEHAAMHLIYARFITKALRDLGYLDFDEPFIKLVHQGMILGPDGNKMSKSKGNTITPDPYIDKYGSDTFRLYLMFGFAYIEGGPWKDEGIVAISKYLQRIETFIRRIVDTPANTNEQIGENEDELLYVQNRTIKAMENDINIFQFNTAIARSMEYFNEMTKYDSTVENKNVALLKECLDIFVTLLSPLAPHFTEEMWELLGHTESVHKEFWPTFDESKLHRNLIKIPVQVNGKVKLVVKIKKESSQEELKEIIHGDPAIQKILETNTIVKEIYVPQKVYNIVTKAK